jgi:hypothetical protein
MNEPWLKSFDGIRSAVAHDQLWVNILGTPGSGLPPCRIHLAVFVEPFLGYILDGTKTVESRFSINQCAPYGKVSPGDAILVKKSGGPIVAVARVQTIWSYQIDNTTLAVIRNEFAQAIRATDDDFWEQRHSSNYATLMLIDHVLTIKPVAWKKNDRRGWVVVHSREQQSLFERDSNL